MNFAFNMTLDEANIVLEALQELPHKRVAQLVMKIHSQGEAHLRALEVNSMPLEEAQPAPQRKAGK